MDIDQGPHDLSHLLSSYATPTPLEANIIHIRIAKLTGKAFGLQLQLQELEDQVRQHCAMLSILRTLPLETLGEIFCFVLPQVLHVEDTNQLTNLMLVCKTWHRAALLTHRLWSSLQISLLPTGSPSFERVISWFGRAREFPKTLVIDATWEMEADCRCPNTICFLLRTPLLRLLAEGPPLDNLSVSCSGPQCIKTVLDSLDSLDTLGSGGQRRPWYMIRSLDLTFIADDCEWYEPLNPSDSMFFRLPSALTSLSLSLPEMESTFFDDTHALSTPLRIPQAVLKRLSTLHIACDWGGNQISETVRHCVNIETLTIDFFSTLSTQSTQDLMDTFLPKLHTLRLLGVFPHQTDILKHISAPALRHLEIEFGLDWDNLNELEPDFLSSSLKNFFHQPSNSEVMLQHLRIGEVTIETDDLFDTLIDLPSLTHLTLDNVHLYGDIFEELDAVLRDTGKPPLPQLEMLDLLRLSPGFRPASVVKFLTRRQGDADLGDADVGGGLVDVVLPRSMRTLNVTYSEGESSDFSALNFHMSGLVVSVKHPPS